MTRTFNHLEQQFPAVAIAAYQCAAKLKPKTPTLHQRLGDLLTQREQYEAAIAACRQAVQLNPDIAWFHHSLAKALLGHGQPATAIVALHQAIALDPDVIWFHYTLSEVLLQQEDWQGAIAALRRCRELDNSLPWIDYHLGRALLETGQVNEAIELYEQAIQQHADFAGFKEQLVLARSLQDQAAVTLDTLLLYPPRLHRHEGSSVSLGVSAELLQFIDRRVDRTSHTLETGAGISTVLFALKQTTHICVVPDAELVERIKDFCDRHQLSTEKITFHIGGSEQVLPRLELGGLDFVLIDGRHAFPTPFIDWYYTAAALKVGGITVVDDTRIWTGDVLKDFLKLEAEWRLEAELPQVAPNAAAFVKVKDGSHAKWWAQQPYVMRQSPQAEIVG